MSEDEKNATRLECLRLAMEFGVADAESAVQQALVLYEFVTNETLGPLAGLMAQMPGVGTIYPGAVVGAAQQDQTRNLNAGPDIHWGAKTK